MSSSSGLPAVGAHCALAACNLNDFLPIRCQCAALFCAAHIAPDAHACPLLAATPRGDQSESFKLERCAAAACTKPSLESFVARSAAVEGRVPALCPGCGRAFCAEHREPAAHACAPPPPDPAAPPAPVKNAAAKALLAAHFGTPASRDRAGSKPAAAGSARAQEAKRKVAAMKMRQQAKAGDPKDAAASVAVDQRLHVRVAQAGQPATERVFWFRKGLVAGRALDMLATHFRMTISDSQPLRLLLTDNGADGAALQNDRPLEEQISDGSTLVLSR
ncbi:uncharacterized protein BXZ73DRAFT_50669 [Epithele typhae]|uniref:uncharacterized protein n=1 Tax=Epithele typhae TaxID=378194 RepID=UPI0020082CB3|nr:uncharacterized protein BXZ73DRAFT_50669 [Epithele typhae]KAH9923988.1 hypothetical protein BXZ73DRAFT_50669 [Epithele typhae]